MNKKISKSILIILIIFGITLGGIRVFRAFAAGRDGFQTFLQVFEVIKKHYVKKNLDETKLFYGAIRGLLYSLNDPYTRFLEPKSFSEMKIRMKGSFGGIGIQIGMKNEILTVIAPLEDTPAFRAGLRSLDQILAIDGETTAGIALEEAVQKIRGPKNTKVKLLIMRKTFKKPKEFEVVRDIINIEDLKYTLLGSQTGYLRLISFESEKIYDKVTVALQELKKQKAQNFIIDVRNNGGGLLQNALEISGLFLEKGRPVVVTIDRDGQKETFSAEGGYIGKYPLVVLINEASASASEILAGAIQDNKAGVLIGEKTFGKASVQTIRSLWDGSALLYTVAKYLTPLGRDITEKGIEPDVVIKTAKENNGQENSEVENYQLSWPPQMEKDPVLQKALGILNKNTVPDLKNKRAFLDTPRYFPYS